MAITDIDIAAQALIQLGAEPIQSFSGDDTETVVTSNRYETIKKSQISDYYWNFATTVQQLSKLVTPPTLSMWSEQFQLPADYLRVVDVTDSYGYSIPYLIQKGRVFANHTDVFLTYLRNIDENEFPFFFVELLIARCAYEWAHPITSDENLTAQRFRDYEDKLRIAKGADASENPAIKVIDHAHSNYINVRFRDY